MYILEKKAKTTSDHFKEVFIFMKRFCAYKLLFPCLMLALLFVPVQAATVESVGGETYCFQTEDFMTSPTPGNGIYLCEVPDASVGTLYYGGRALRTGDVLPTDALRSVEFRPVQACDALACVSYYTIWDDKLSDESILTIRLRSGENQPPVAKDVSLETYKNLEKSGAFDASDPDGDELTYTIVKTPKRGTLAIEDDGTFVYTPKENKVGPDSFTYTVTDPSGSVSNEATVSIEILKPMDKATYADMKGDSREFEALWMRSTGLLEGSQVTGQLCFCPEETVTRGDYLVMLMTLAGIAPEEADVASTFADADATPQWMQGYLCSALRRGIIRGVNGPDGLCFCPHAPITQAQAAVIAQNILKLDTDSASAVFARDDAVPTWAGSSLDALTQAGVTLPTAATAPMNRRDTASMLYQISKLL